LFEGSVVILFQEIDLFVQGVELFLEIGFLDWRPER
jgi:hypothetical protein